MYESAERSPNTRHRRKIRQDLCAALHVRDYVDHNFKPVTIILHLHIKCAEVYILNHAGPPASSKESLKTIILTVPPNAMLISMPSSGIPAASPFHGASSAIQLNTRCESVKPQTSASSSGLVLGMSAPSPHFVAIFVQDERYRRHDGRDNGHDRQRPMRADGLVHLDRRRAQRPRDQVA